METLETPLYAISDALQIALYFSGNNEVQGGVKKILNAWPWSLDKGIIVNSVALETHRAAVSVRVSSGAYLMMFSIPCTKRLYALWFDSKAAEAGHSKTLMGRYTVDSIFEKIKPHVKVCFSFCPEKNAWETISCDDIRLSITGDMG